MKLLKTGKFFGETDQTLHLDGITLTNTEYTHGFVDWHYHENAYFTFLIAGKVIEGNKKEKYTCMPGSLLFHHCEEPHYNIKPSGYTRGMHIELQKNWFLQNSFYASLLQGNINIINPDVKIMIYTIHKELKVLDGSSEIIIHETILKIVEKMLHKSESTMYHKPAWVSKVKEILYDRSAEKISLKCLADELKIHSVHLSRDFSKHFRCTIGQYMRKIKIEKSLSLLQNKKHSLTDISTMCGFADQSHYLRCFKEFNGLNPSEFRKIILR